MDIIGSELALIQGFEADAGQFEVSVYTHSKRAADALRALVTLHPENFQDR